MKMKKQIWQTSSPAGVIFAAALTVFISGCGANEDILRSGKNANTADVQASPVATSTSPTPEVATSVEQDIESMKTADFVYIYVFRRKDKAPLDQDDKAIARSLTEHLNRRKLSSDGTAIIVGSNSYIPEESMKVLTAHFDLEDHSKPDSEQK